MLFVAEKRAALDVVARRLDAVGMGMFALDLHDKGSRASMVRAQIRLALEHAVAVDEQGLAADEETLRSARRMLARYADRLHDDNAAGPLALLGAHVRAGRRHGRRAAAGARAVRRQRPGRGAAARCGRRCALLPDIADLTRPSLRHPWAFVDSPAIDLPAHPGRRGRGGRRRARGGRRSPSWPACCAGPGPPTSSTRSRTC